MLGFCNGHKPPPTHSNAAVHACTWYQELLRTIAGEAGLKPFLVPVPFAVWHALAQVAELLPNPPVTRNQVELMRIDTVASQQLPGLAELDISPQAIEDTVRHLAHNR